MIALRNILVATDFGEAADVALRYGQTLAKHFGTHLHVLHADSCCNRDTRGCGRQNEDDPSQPRAGPREFPQRLGIISGPRILASCRLPLSSSLTMSR